MRLQSRHQVPVHLNKRLLGHLILIQDQLGGDGTCHLRQLILYNNYLENNADSQYFVQQFNRKPLENTKTNKLS